MIKFTHFFLPFKKMRQVGNVNTYEAHLVWLVEGAALTETRLPLGLQSPLWGALCPVWAQRCSR